MYRHVTLLIDHSHDETRWKLLGPDGQPFLAFDLFVKAIRELRLNTRKNYCRHLAEFIDYLIEAQWVLAGGGLLTRSQLTEVIEAYGDYLLLGTSAIKEAARKIAERMPPSCLNRPASLMPKKAAIRRWLKLSNTYGREVEMLAKLNDGNAATHQEPPLLPEVGTRRSLQEYEKRAMRAKSMLAGVIAGGPRFIEAVPLGKDVAQTFEASRAFPYDKIIDFIHAFPTYRDRCHYALLAASGCRGSEGRQILIDDINMEDATVALVDPSSRPADPSYCNLSSGERELLAWKGRATDLALLIEPFRSIFFECLEQYLSREYIDHGRHSFLFQYSNRRTIGAPYYLFDSKERIRRFHQALKKVGVVLPRNTAEHSLRHMYGCYLVNYFPRSDKSFGLPLSIVMQLMGHANIEITKKYAVIDETLKQLEVAHANEIIFGNGTPLSLLELKLAALNAEAERVIQELERRRVAA